MGKPDARKPGESILTVQVAQETDFLLARQRAKQIAALLGFDLQDQTRIATAVSEIARNAYEYGEGGKVEFLLGCNPTGWNEFRIVVADNGRGIARLDAIWNGTYTSPTGMGLGLIGARRLMDDLEVQTGVRGTTVTMLKRLLRPAAPPPVSEVVKELLKTPPRQSAAMQEQDQELLGLLEEIRQREAELRVVNQELEETNRGVLVLYAELEDKARAVQQASEMKTRFLSSVTHELRTPLNSIVSLSRLMLSHQDGPLNAEQEKQTQFILRSAQNLTEMVSDLLDVARVEAGKATVTLSQFSVAELLAGLRGMFRTMAGQSEVRLIFEIPSEPLRLETDEAKLAQILRNFISNALKFTERGSVTVTVQGPEQGRGPAASGSAAEGVPEGREPITFAVSDTGEGIAPEYHELIMQEWGQAPSALQGRQKGSGLGLPLSRGFAELLGGRVDFTSVPGQGSTFRVTLPALLRDTSHGEPFEPEDGGNTGGRQDGHVLMADDDEVARYLLRRRLAAHTTAEITEAASGEEALEAIRRHRPHVLFLDLVMPGLGGFEVVRRLREDPSTADLPIVLHTSKVLNPQELEALRQYDLTLIPKRDLEADPDERDEQSAEIERALLQVGLSNAHEQPQPNGRPDGRPS